MVGKNKVENLKINNGGKMARIGHKFHKEIKEIQRERLKSGLDEEKIGTQKITNLITHNHLWKDIKKEIIFADENEINNYG